MLIPFCSNQKVGAQPTQGFVGKYYPKRIVGVEIFRANTIKRQKKIEKKAQKIMFVVYVTRLSASLPKERCIHVLDGQIKYLANYRMKLLKRYGSILN